VQVTVVGPADLPELLLLMRAYCDFYQVGPGDHAVLDLADAGRRPRRGDERPVGRSWLTSGGQGRPGRRTSITSSPGLRRSLCRIPRDLGGGVLSHREGQAASTLMVRPSLMARWAAS
jgi:hypothetical protein